MPAMLTPRMRQQPPAGQPWAADTGCFADPAAHTDDGYLAWLASMLPVVERCLFATAPDSVGDAATTLVLAAPMYERIREAGYRVALVAQDGLEKLTVPWDEIDALFIGGSTAWKLGDAARELGQEARRQGKWLHMGRVNSMRRLRVAANMGCQSADGTYLRFGPDKNAARMAGWLEDLHREPSLWEPE